MPDGTLTQELLALAQVVLIDLTLAGDNAVVVGLAVATACRRTRSARRSWSASAGAAVIRIALGAITLQLLAIVGLLLAGGLLLLWVCWRMYRELRRGGQHAEAAAEPAKPKSLRTAMVEIVLADLSMSLDNVLAVAGASNGHTWVLVTGLVLSVVLMGVAATMIAKLLERYRWIAWAGLLVVLFVALRLIWDGGHEVLEHLARPRRLSYAPHWIARRRASGHSVARSDRTMSAPDCRVHAADGSESDVQNHRIKCRRRRSHSRSFGTVSAAQAAPPLAYATRAGNFIHE